MRFYKETFPKNVDFWNPARVEWAGACGHPFNRITPRNICSIWTMYMQNGDIFITYPYHYQNHSKYSAIDTCTVIFPPSPRLLARFPSIQI
jgi:hypothetical protein